MLQALSRIESFAGNLLFSNVISLAFKPMSQATWTSESRSLIDCFRIRFERVDNRVLSLIPKAMLMKSLTQTHWMLKWNINCHLKDQLKRWILRKNMRGPTAPSKVQFNGNLHSKTDWRQFHFTMLRLVSWKVAPLRYFMWQITNKIYCVLFIPHTDMF